MTSAERDEQAPEGLIAGKYRLNKLLGRGGMGAVWEGVHTSLGTRVAVKFIDREYASSEDIRQRFVNEAKATARLRSKHVVQVYDQGVTEDGRPYIVMEFLAGEPLDARLDRLSRLTPADTARILLQVARALTKAHDVGIVHRDLKPENVFLVWDEEDQTDIVKVVDFGIAKFTDSSAGHSSGSTRTGAVLGTPHYMSPEQARGLRSVDARTDIWSLGVIAYRCVVGKLPFEGEAVGDLLVNICTANPPIASQIAPDIPVGFDAFVTRALAREPAQRFPNAQEFSEALCVACGVDVRSPAGAMALSSSQGAPKSIPARTAAPLRSDPASETGVPLTKTLAGTAKRTQIFIGLGVSGAALIGLLGFFATRASRDVDDPGRALAAEPPVSPPSVSEVEPEPASPSPPPPPKSPEVTPEVTPTPEPPPPDSASKPAAAAPPKVPVAAPSPRPPPKPKQPETAPPKAPPKPPQDLLGY